MSTFFRLSLSLLLLCLGALSLNAQEPVVKGRVMDEDGQPMIQASVQLMQGSTQHAGAVTNTDGYFTIKARKAGKYQLKVSYVGYNDLLKSVDLREGQTLQIGQLNLEEDANVLEQLVVTGKAAEIVVRADTLEFNADSYLVQEGATLEDLVKKLPGAEIDENGKLTINGQEISKIMVDGKEFFSKDSRVAMKNLPADMINKVQVLNRLSEMSRMSGFDDGEEETVINLTVKPGRKQGLFGTAMAGYGTQDRYELNANVNSFGDGKQWTLIAGSNNTNNMGFSDLGLDNSAMSMGGGRGGGHGRGGMFDMGGITTSSMGGANFNIEFSPKFSTGGDARYGYNDRSIVSRKTVENILESGNTFLQENTDERSYSHNGGASMKITWKPDDKTELIFEPNLTASKINSVYTDEYNTDRADGSFVNKGLISQISEGKSLAFDGTLSMSRKLNDDGRTLSAQLSGGTSREDAEGIYQADIEDALTQNSTDQKQFNTIDNLNYRIRLSYVEPLGKNYFLQAIANTRFSRRSQDRDVYGVNADGVYDELLSDYGTQYQNDYTQYRLGLNIKKVAKLWEYTLGFNVDPNVTTSLRTLAGVEQDKISIRRTNISPMIRFNYKPNRNTSFRIDYRGRTRQPSINQLAPIQDITNPLLITVGNEKLRPSYSNNIFMRYQTFNPTSQLSLNVSSFLSYVFDDIVSKSIYDPQTGVRTTMYDNVSGNWSARAFSTMSVPLSNRSFSLRASVMGMLSRQIGFVNNEENRAVSFRTGERLTLTYRNSWFDTSLGGTFAYYGVNNSLEGQRANNTFDVAGKYEAALNLPMGFRIDSDIEYSTNMGYSSGYKRNEWLWNAAVSYSFLTGKSATVRLKAYDILSQRSSIFSSSTPFSITEQQSNTLSSYVILHFIYRFNAFKGGASRSDMQENSFGPGRRFRG